MCLFTLHVTYMVYFNLQHWFADNTEGHLFGSLFSSTIIDEGLMVLNEESQCPLSAGLSVLERLLHLVLRSNAIYAAVSS